MSVRNLVTLVYLFAGEIRNGRKLEDVLRHADSEMVELRQEIILVGAGHPEGDDGVVGEAVDIIACVVDLLHEFGVARKTAVRDIDLIVASQPVHTYKTLPEFAKAIEDELLNLREAVSNQDMVVLRSAFLLRTLLLLIRHHSPDTTMEQVEEIALKKCEKWKLHYSKSVERVRVNGTAE